MKRAAIRAMGTAVLVVALGAVVAGGVAAKPSGAGPGPPSGNKLSAKSCQKGNWDNLVRTDGTGFASEQECTSYAAGGGTLQPKAPSPYPEAKALCESYGGSFGVGGPNLVDPSDPSRVLWVCNSMPFVDSTAFGWRGSQLAVRCVADGGLQEFPGGTIGNTNDAQTEHYFTCYA